MKNCLIYFKLFLLIPIILLLCIIRIFIDFRISKIISHKIGHLTFPMEIYICEKKDDPEKVPVIWFFDKIISNEFIKKKWSKKLLILPRLILEPIHILFRKYKLFDIFLIDYSKELDVVKRSIKYGVKHIDNNNVLLKYKPSIEFNYKENNDGESYLRKIGFNNEKFFAFSSRTSEFHFETSYSSRNSNIYDKILGVKSLVSKGYKSIRMGKDEKKLNFNDSNIIDYASSIDRSDFLDVYLASKCEFMISDNSGINELAALFRKPRLIVNEYEVHNLDRRFSKSIILLKKIKNSNTGKFISFEEAYKKKLNLIDSTIELNKLGYEIIDNNEFEIKEALESMLDLIKNRLSLDEVLKNQKNYWQNLEKYFEVKNNNKTIICPNFYSNNINLFEL